MKFAYFVTPHIGGTYTVYKAVHAALAEKGIVVRWLGVGPSAKAIFEDPVWESDRSIGEITGEKTEQEKEQAQALIEHIETEAYDGVFVNAACNRVHGNVVRYLDSRIRRIMTVHTITVATYSAARALRDFVHSTVCVSPRIRHDLIKRNGFSEQYTRVIPNALDLRLFGALEDRVQLERTLRLLSIGRLSDMDKGSFWLPRIMDRLSDLPVKLTVAGDGPDEAELRRRCAHLGDRVRFLGRVAPDHVPKVFAEHDVFLFPSRFEGLGLALVEAMAAGCVPVASRIKGVTDFVVQDGVDGFLFSIGDISGAAHRIKLLARDRGRLGRVAVAAQRNVAGRFDLSAMGCGYADVVRSVVEAPREIAAPLSLSAWSYPAGLRPGLRTYLPEEVKKMLRLWRERLV